MYARILVITRLYTIVKRLSVRSFRQFNGKTRSSISKRATRVGDPHLTPLSRTREILCSHLIACIAAINSSFLDTKLQRKVQHSKHFVCIVRQCVSVCCAISVCWDACWTNVLLSNSEKTSDCIFADVFEKYECIFSSLRRALLF